MAQIDPWGGLEIKDYSHVFREFGLKPFLPAVSKKLGHYLFERGIIIAHRDFEPVLECISKKKPFVNITGIAASGPLHLGHKVDLDLFLFFNRS